MNLAVDLLIMDCQGNVGVCVVSLSMTKNMWIVHGFKCVCAAMMHALRRERDWGSE